MEREAYAPYASVMHPAGQEPSMVLWFIPTIIGAWYLLYLLTQRSAPITLKNAAVAGIILTLVMDAVFNSSMYMYFANFPVQAAMIGMGADIVTGAIAGASLGLIYNAMAKKA